MSDIDIRICGRVGRITLTRPSALNALSYAMCLAIEAALEAWADNDAVAVVVIDAQGDKAFCAGGDIAELYQSGTRGDFAYGQTFWADEYRLNHKIYCYDKPVVSFLHGFTMGGGVGIGCHGSHRIVGETSKIAMPECAIGLVPDVGGSMILANAPGRLGTYLGTTGARMGADDAIVAGFADVYVPQEKWPDLIVALEESGDPAIIKTAQTSPPPGILRIQRGEIDDLFRADTLCEIHAALRRASSEFAAKTLKQFEGGCPLSLACFIEMMQQMRGATVALAEALAFEYRFTYRASEFGDFLEGVRAKIVEKDGKPKWQFDDMDVPAAKVEQMLQPLGENGLKLEENA